ncbi:unnamed protein product, partial [Ectocarpus sp. 8 AP-2014]
MPSRDNGGKGPGSMSSADLEAEIGDPTVEVKMQIGESHMSEEEKGGYGTPHDTNDGDEERESSHGGDVVSEAGSTDQQRHEEAETAPGNDGGEQKGEKEG